MNDNISINKIYGEDCLVTMSKMKDKFCDIVITSPPYNLNLRVNGGKYISRQIIKEFTTKYNGFDDNMPIEDYYVFHGKVIKELLRVSNIIFYNIQIVTGSKRAFFKLIGDYSDNLKEIIIWDKGHAQPAMRDGVLNRQTEIILVFDSTNAINRRFDKSFFKRGTLNDIWKIKKARYNKSHGAAFPEELVEKILENFTNEGDIVYDPFAGRGTTAVVCKRKKRNFIVSEIVKEYIDLINTNLSNEK